jgi:hypothetical protein
MDSQTQTAGFEHPFDIFNQFATDPKLELEGAWVKIGPPTKYDEQGKPVPDSEPQIKVARAGNERHGRIAVQLYETNEHVLSKKDDIAKQRDDELTAEAMAKGILLDWKNLSFKGKRVEDGWNYEAAYEMLMVKEFRNLVNRHANDMERYKVVQEAAAAKN